MRRFGQKVVILFITQIISFQAWGSDKELSDGLGRKWPLDYKPQKIASTFLAGDEILIEILKRTPGKLIATSTVSDDNVFSNIISKLKDVPYRIGNNAEFIAKIKPDLVFVASWNRPDFLESLSKLKIKTFTISNFDSIKDIERNILLMGQVLHVPEESAEIVKKMQEKMPQVPAKKIKIARFDPSGFAIGRSTIFDSIIQRLGLTNAVEHEGWPKLSPEAIATLNPDIIIASGDTSDKKLALDSMRIAQGWKVLDAVKKERVIMVPERLLSSASQYVVETYEFIQGQMSKLQAKR